MNRLEQQIGFIIEVDRLKGILRQTLHMDGRLYENDAEHSWHLALMALILVEYAAPEKPDLLHTIKMLLIHDLVEIDAGDTYVYDEKRYEDKARREQAAADRIFALLPADQATEIRSLWEEFEARQTPEARFGAALDRLQPLLHNYATQGVIWQKHGITCDRVLARNRHMAEGAPALWEYAEKMIRSAVEKGYLEPKPNP
jgi:putative hydrolase of HD superfamily